MANPHGSFVWHELMTTDTKAAEAFYRDAVGWGAQTPSMTLPGVDYTLFTVGSTPAAGLMNILTDFRRWQPISWPKM